MIRHFAMSVLMSGVLAASVSAQSRTAATAQYDPSAEAAFGGVITQVISVVGPDGTVGVHLKPQDRHRQGGQGPRRAGDVHRHE
jgi:hypothetical protein